ncbi:MAG: hypothetical protein AAF399_24975, partial [Bacteroidota bacterium]
YFRHQHRKVNRIDKALELANSYHVAYPHEPRAIQEKSLCHFLKGKSLNQKGLYASAIDQFNQTVTLGPAQLTQAASLRIGLAYSKMEQYENAIAATYPIAFGPNVNDTAVYHLARYYAKKGGPKDPLPFMLLLDFYWIFTESYDYFQQVALEEKHFLEVRDTWWFQNWLNHRIRISLTDFCANNIPDKDYSPHDLSDLSDPLLEVLYGEEPLGNTSHVKDQLHVCWAGDTISFDYSLEHTVPLQVQLLDADYEPHKRAYHRWRGSESRYPKDDIHTFLLLEDKLKPHHEPYQVFSIQENSAPLSLMYSVDYHFEDLNTYSTVTDFPMQQAYLELGECVKVELTRLIRELSPIGSLYETFFSLEGNQQTNQAEFWQQMSGDDLIYMLHVLKKAKKLGEYLEVAEKLLVVLESGENIIDCYQEFSRKVAP